MTIRALTCTCCLLICAMAPVAAADAGGSSSRDQLITLETSEKPMDVVLQWISRRAGVNIVSNEEELPKITATIS